MHVYVHVFVCAYVLYEVWWPDGLLPTMAWKSDGLEVGCGGFINPFAHLGSQMLADHWTERMPAEAQDLQWTLPLPDVGDIARTRGNEGLATQHAMPKWMKKHEYLAFCSLRAFPCQQLRKLLVALQEQSLPLAQPAVQHMVRQLLHHVGPVEQGELYWKTDVGALLGEFQEALESLVDEFCAKPRDHQALPVLADILNYFLLWPKPPGPDDFWVQGCRRLSEAAMQWVKDVLNGMQGLDSEHQEKLRAKAWHHFICSVSAHVSKQSSKVEQLSCCAGLPLRSLCSVVHTIFSTDLCRCRQARERACLRTE